MSVHKGKVNTKAFKHVSTPRYSHYKSIEDRSNMSVHTGKVTTSQYESVQTGQYTKVWSLQVSRRAFKQVSNTVVTLI